MAGSSKKVVTALMAKVLFTLLLFLLIGVSWLLFSNGGAKLVFNAVQAAVPGLKVSRLDGRLIGPLMLQGFEFKNENLKITLREGSVDWRPSHLLRGDLLVAELIAKHLHITQLAPAPPSKEPFKLPSSLPLPLNSRIVSLSVDDIQWRSAADAQPIVVDKLTAQLEASSDWLNIKSIAVSGPQFSVSGFAHCDLGRNYKSEAGIDWQLQIENQADVSGQLTASGDLDKLDAQLRAHAKTERFGSFSARLAGHGSPHLITVNTLELLLDDSDLALGGRGVVSFGTNLASSPENLAPTVDAELEWQQLQWPLPAIIDQAAVASSSISGAEQEAHASAVLVTSESGQLDINGTLNEFQLKASAVLTTPQTPEGHLQLNASGSAQHLDVTELTLKALGGTVDGTAKIEWSNTLNSQFNLVGKTLNPGELLAQWPGSINFSLQGSQLKQAVAIENLVLDGVLRELPISAKAKLEVDGASAQVERLELRSGESKLNANGALGENSNFSWQLNSRDLGSVHPSAAGKVSSTGRISGAISSPAVAATLNAQGVRFQNIALSSVDLDAELEFQSEKHSRLNLAIGKSQISGVGIEQASLTLAGNRDAHDLQLRSNTEYGDAALKVSAALGEERWSGKLLSGQISPPEMASWKLESATDFLIGKNQQTIEHNCWRSEQSSLCVQGQVDGEQISGDLKIEQFDLASLQALIADELQLQGSVDADATFKQSAAGQWDVRAQFDSTTSTLSVRADGDQPEEQLLNLKPGLIKLEGQPSKLDAEITLPFDSGGGIDGRVAVTDSGGSFANGQLSGKIDVNIPQLTFLSSFSPEIRSASGALNGSLAVQGSVSNPEPQGELLLTDATLELVSPGLSIHDLELTATANSSGNFVYKGKAISDGGRIELDGNTLIDDQGTNTQLSLKGAEVQIWNTADARIWASPDIQVVANDQQIEVSGEVVVPRASITPKELPQSAVGVSRDQVIVTLDEHGQQQVSAEQQNQVTARVKLVLGNQVDISGFGFNGRLEGNLDVEQKPLKPLVASGELNVKEGEYRAYGQGLVVDRGQFLFAGGEIDNPGLSVRALRRPADGIVVGVNVLGELRQPEITLFSEPRMSSSDQLSWLVLGRPMESASGAESDYIAQAALALGIKGGNFLTKGIGENLGLDSIGIQTGSGEAGAASDVNQAALVIGKYLTPKLYVSYGVGLLESISTVKLRYLMTKRWSLLTESSAVSSGGDVSYSFEK